MNLTKEQAIEQIHGRVLAIENDDKGALNKCLKYFWPESNWRAQGIYKYYVRMRNNKNDFTFYDEKELPQSIPATELLRILEVEWMPEVGKEYEFSNNDLHFATGKLLAIVDSEYKYIVKLLDRLQPTPYVFCRPIQKKQITIAELLKETGRNENEWEVVK